MQIVSLEFFADLYQDMLGVDILHAKRNVIMGVHPRLGQISFMEMDPFTGDGVLTHLNPHAPYIRRKGELTPGERDVAEQALAAREGHAMKLHGIS